MSEAAADDELRAEYQFDYAQAKPNRFAAAAKAAGRTQIGSAAGVGRGTSTSLQMLREAATVFARDREVAESKAAQINPTLDQLRNVGMLPPEHVVIGSVIHSVDHGESETATYYAAGIRGDGDSVRSCINSDSARRQTI